MNTKKVWFVTGASKGLGLTLVKKLLNQGYKVAATSRTVNDLIEKVGENPNFIAVEVDLVNELSVANAIKKTIDSFGAINVVVNNAGYGQIGTIEELSDSEVRTNFDVNVFGALNVLRCAIPHLRKQQSGHIFNISSVAGYTGGFSGFGIYCATKFAMAGFTEALVEEMNDFNINVTLVYPGYFKTNFLTSDSIKTPKTIVKGYKGARASQEMHLNQINGHQTNSPEKAADVFIKVSETKQPPIHLFLGKDAYEYANLKIETIQAEMTKHKALATSTEF